MNDVSLKPLAAEALRWHCSESAFDFETTAAQADVERVLGQDRATEALRLGARIAGAGHHVYAMGDPATDRLRVVLDSLEREAAGRPIPGDWCYINRFDDPRRPRVLGLAPGQGARLRHDMNGLVDELRASLPAAFESDSYRASRTAIDREFEEREEHFWSELQEDAEQHELGVVRTPQGFAIAAVRDGELLDSEAFHKLPEAEQQEAMKQIERLTELLKKHVQKLPEWMRERLKRVRDLDREVTELAIRGAVGELKAKYSEQEAVSGYLGEVEKDLIDNAQLFRREEQPALPFVLPGGGEKELGLKRYDVNVLVDNGASGAPPVVHETSPTYQNLIGRVEHTAQFGALVTDFTMIRPGALHRANGGFLVIDAIRLLSSPYAWDALKRSLLNREVRIESLGELLSLASTTTLEPERVRVDLRVVLVGPRLVYRLLAMLDEDFPALFSVVADFADTVEREPAALATYGALLGTLGRRAGLRPLHRGAVARLVEESLRSTGDAQRLSVRMRDAEALLREADYLAGEEGVDAVRAEHVERAVAGQVRRRDRLRERWQEAAQRRHVLIDTSGAVTAQVNGLSVVDAGGFSFGHPSRITATVRMGGGEVVDIEREVELGGAIHSKGVMILSAFISSRYAPRFPLSLRASLVFEQSYGGVEGDSASLAEACALLSALADLPLRQDLAVTGSINQLGSVQVVGGLNEKIEGFFDVCNRRGLTGAQGVLIPADNAQHLMLRRDLVDAARDGRFHVYPVRSVDEAIAFLTGTTAGERDESGEYPEGTVNRAVEERLLRFARVRRRFARPRLARVATAGDSGP